MPYTNFEIFRGKGANRFSKKVRELLNFMKKMDKKNHSRRFCCYLEVFSYLVAETKD
jgi:hypothetical protein